MVKKKHNKLLNYFNPSLIEAGCDEAGRGCLAGPVYAAAVIMPHDFYHPLLTDSKLTTKAQRYKLRPIIEKEAISWAVGRMTPKEIDKYNILNASFKAMHRAVKKLGTFPQLLLIDGNRFNAYKGIPHECIIRGDGKYTSIAAASILAKTYRDDYMEKQHKKYPFYGWEHNMGYPTKMHRSAIAEHGPCDLHRKTFRLLAPEKEDGLDVFVPHGM
ncbi:MAG: ribonuclease HII [Saprospiraceae bacterium]|jgi:ribonuclease HII|tara:strand:- start:557 stop:1201 length:645 start_codon:yes stop_codon:yes gene_type:complete